MIFVGATEAMMSENHMTTTFFVKKYGYADEKFLGRRGFYLYLSNLKKIKLLERLFK